MVVSVLCTRTKAQIDRIDGIFRQRYQRTLKEYIEREMGGNLRTFLSYTQMTEVRSPQWSVAYEKIIFTVSFTLHARTSSTPSSCTRPSRVSAATRKWSWRS